MPTIGLFHATFQWNFSDTNAAPVHLGAGGYPLWQASVIAPSLFGIVGAWIDEHWALLKWHWRIAKRLHRLSRESGRVLVRVLDLLESPAYPQAQAAVRGTATTLGFNRPEAWKELGRQMKSDAGRAENMFRHLEAMRRVRETANSTLTNPQQNLLTELAYHGFTITRK